MGRMYRVWLVMADELTNDGLSDRWVDSAHSTPEGAGNRATRLALQWADVVASRRASGHYNGEMLGYTTEWHAIDPKA